MAEPSFAYIAIRADGSANQSMSENRSRRVGTYEWWKWQIRRLTKPMGSVAKRRHF